MSGQAQGPSEHATGDGFDRGFRVVFVPPTPEKPEVHTCDLPQSPSAVYARGLELPKMGTVAECTECGQQWVADWHSHMQIWSPLPRRRWWHRLTRRADR